VKDSGLGGVPREKKMLEGYLPRVIYHQAYQYTKTDRILEQVADPLLGAVVRHSADFCRAALSPVI
jgi:hypothetical protein